MTSSPRSATASRASHEEPSRPTAVILCDDNFGRIDGKTANGLVRHSEAYEIVAVIDRSLVGQDAGEVLDDAPNGIPILANLASVLRDLAAPPATIVLGAAPAGGLLSAPERATVLAAMAHGMNVVNGLHEFLNDDPEFVAAAFANDVQIRDVRRPRPKNELRMFTGRIAEVGCPRIAVLGTDSAIGKRTTATVLTKALNEAGVCTVMVGTGQTGLMQGARHGVALDAVPAQFAAGEMEAAVLAAWDAEHPELIVVEGQGSLSHPAYCSSAFILRGSQPAGVVLQHAPKRTARSDFPAFPMPSPSDEIRLIEHFADTRVIGMTLNHEGMSDAEVSAAIALYELEFPFPVTDALTRPSQRLVDMVLEAFPDLLVTRAVGAT